MGKELFGFPHGIKSDWLFTQFKEKLASNGGPQQEEAVEFAEELNGLVAQGDTTRSNE